MDVLCFMQNLKKESYPKIEFVPAEVCLFLNTLNSWSVVVSNAFKRPSYGILNLTEDFK